MAAPYYCIRGDPAIYINVCNIEQNRINITVLIEQTEKYARSGLIDPTSNMLNDRVFIYHGMSDPFILPGNMPLNSALLSDFLRAKES